MRVSKYSSYREKNEAFYEICKESNEYGVSGISTVFDSILNNCRYIEILNHPREIVKGKDITVNTYMINDFSALKNKIIYLFNIHCVTSFNFNNPTFCKVSNYISMYMENYINTLMEVE